MKAFESVPDGQPFALAVEAALEHLAAQLDDDIAKALGGGDGTGRTQVPLPRLTAAREALKTPAERIAEADLVARLNADLDAWNTQSRYEQALADAAEQPADVESEQDRAWRIWNRNQGLIAEGRAAERRPARSFRDLYQRHRDALARDRHQHIT